MTPKACGAGRARTGLRIVLGAFMLALPAACAAPQADRYYSLQAPGDRPPAAAAHEPAARTPEAPPYRVRLSVVQIPVEVDRAQLVVQETAGDPAVQVLNESLWVAPLHDQLEDGLLEGVSRRLGLPETQGLPDRPDSPLRRIAVRINQFGLQWGRAASLSASWTDESGSKPTRLCEARLRQPATEQSVAALVRAQRAVVRQLALLIADGQRTPDAGSPGNVEVLEFGCT